MNKQGLVRSLDRLTKPAAAKLILAAGLKAKDERILYAWYISERTVYEIADMESVQKESAYNQIAAARKRLVDIIVNQAHLLPKEIQPILDFLNRPARDV